MHEIAAQLLNYVKATWKHRWYAVIVAWIISVAGWVFVYFVPDRYEASARVFVDTQSILRPLLSGLAVQPNIDQQVTMMSRTLISRPNVEKVIRMADLDIKTKTAEDKDGLVSRLMSNIQIRTTGRDNLYTIAYDDKNPEIAKRVVQSLLTLFVEGSLGDNRKDADAARRFIEDQIKAYEQKLAAAEDALKEFKRKNMGMMPGSGGDYYSRMAAAKASVDQARLELKEAENARDSIKKQLLEDQSPPVVENDATSIVNPELDGRIETLKKNLDQLRLNYTELHPDIVATKRLIGQLEQQKIDQAKAQKPTTGISAAAAQNPIVQQLKAALTEAESGVASMKARVGEYENRFEQLKAAANAIPQIEAEFTQLNRDYEIQKQNYNQLVSRRESADMAGQMEASTGGAEFRIIDPPRVPFTPTAPNRPLLMSLVLLGALAAGVAVAFLVSQIRPTFNDRKTLTEVTGLPLLGGISMIWTDAQRKMHKKRLIAFIMSIAGLLGSYGALMAALFLFSRTA